MADKPTNKERLKDLNEKIEAGYCQELCAKSVCRLRLNEVSQQ